MILAGLKIIRENSDGQPSYIKTVSERSPRRFPEVSRQKTNLVWARFILLSRKTLNEATYSGYYQRLPFALNVPIRVDHKFSTLLHNRDVHMSDCPRSHKHEITRRVIIKGTVPPDRKEWLYICTGLFCMNNFFSALFTNIDKECG